MIFGEIYTSPMEDHTAKEVGYFHEYLSVPDVEFARIVNRRDYLKKQIASTLAHAVYSTQVPMEYWSVSINADIARTYDLPLAFNGDRG